MKIAANESTPATRSGRCGPAPGKALLVCSDLLDLRDEIGCAASHGRRSLRDAVRDAERRRRQRQREALAAPL